MSKNILTEAHDRYFYRNVEWLFDGWENTGGISGREIVARVFTAGAQWGITETSALSPHIAKFIEMMILLGYLDDDNTSTKEVGDTPSDYPSCSNCAPTPPDKCDCALHSMSDHILIHSTIPWHGPF